jgi:hypothetical protein
VDVNIKQEIYQRNIESISRFYPKSASRSFTSKILEVTIVCRILMNTFIINSDLYWELYFSIHIDKNGRLHNYGFISIIQPKAIKGYAFWVYWDSKILLGLFYGY